MLYFAGMTKTRWKIAQYFERKWWQNYLKKKDSVKYLQWKKEYWVDLLSLFNYKLDDIDYPVLDVGCGPAGIFTILTRGKVVGVDPLIGTYIKDGFLNPEHFPEVSFKSIPFENYQPREKFHTIFCLNAINHFEKIDYSFKKLSQICAPGGTLLISIDAHKYKMLKRIFSLFQFDILHPHQYTLEDYMDYLKKNDFEVVSKKLKEKHSVFDYWVLLLRKRS